MQVICNISNSVKLTLTLTLWENCPIVRFKTSATLKSVMTKLYFTVPIIRLLV